jgi:hypothetical protein
VHDDVIVRLGVGSFFGMGSKILVVEREMWGIPISDGEFGG